MLDIPQKRYESNDVSFLDHDEVDALLSAPDRSSRIGRRDHALLTLALQTGLRVSEITALRRRDLELGAGAHVTCRGKGRKNRSTPLTRPSAAVIRAWLKEIPDFPNAPLFPGPRGEALSRDAVRRLVTRHTLTAQQRCPSLRTKRLTPHVLRHSCAMALLQAGVDLSTIALWLGHERHRNHPDLPSRGPETQGTSDRPNSIPRQRNASLPSERLPTGFPRDPRIMRRPLITRPPPGRRRRANRGPPHERRRITRRAA